LRGVLPAAGKKFLWGAVEPGCDVTRFTDNKRGEVGTVTKVWFLREEVNYLRPVVDAYGPFYCTFNALWGNPANPEDRFAQLLLTPSANNQTLREFATGFFKTASVACMILGHKGCIDKIKTLASLGDLDLRNAACSYLKSQFGETCTPVVRH
jgi:hypothetical protein